VNAVRVPVVAGVAGGVGCTTVAVALRAWDGGRCTPAGDADVWVSRGTAESLSLAATLAGRPDGRQQQPVLAVTTDGRPLPPELLAPLERRFGRIVPLPHVERWVDRADHLAEVAMLLTRPSDRLPRALRPYAAALRILAEAVTASGRLHPRSPALWPGLLPVERLPGPAGPSRRRVVRTPVPPVGRPAW